MITMRRNGLVESFIAKFFSKTEVMLCENFGEVGND